jgi:hypothetical protein
MPPLEEALHLSRRYVGQLVDQTMSAPYLGKLSSDCYDISYMYMCVGDESRKIPIDFEVKGKGPLRLEIGIYCPLNILTTLCLADFKLHNLIHHR